MINVLKLGGGAGVEHDAALRNLASRVERGERWVLVHGASAAANALAEQVGCPAQTLTTPSGHTSRYTDARTIEIFSAAAGSVNQQLTARLEHYGARAVGLGGPNLIRAERKKAIRAIKDGRQFVVRDDYSGTITHIDRSLLLTLLNNDLVPVVAPLAMGNEYERLNVDGDLAAAAIARQLAADTLIILSNVPGLLRDINDPTSLIEHIAFEELEQYETFANGRMKKKLLAAAQAEIERVIVADSRMDNPLDTALAGGGTQIIRSLLHVDY
jgi:acetylglutamate/LysW-gamma-L-alpha-aminoadipate kinase